MTIDRISELALWMILPLFAVGSLLHFVYEWTGRTRVAAFFSAVNESTWEHVKLGIWPILLLDVVLYAAGGHEHAAFLPAATIALYSFPVSLVGIVLIYKAFTHRNVLWVDIAAFGLCIAIAQLIFVGVLQQLQPSTLTIIFAGIYLGGLVGAFARFTLRPPAEPDPFIDPITGTYGEPADDDH